MTTLVKTRSLLDLLFWKRPIYLGVEGSVIESMTLTQEAWVDMGCPSTITVTVEPGDKLNEETS